MGIFSCLFTKKRAQNYESSKGAFNNKESTKNARGSASFTRNDNSEDETSSQESVYRADESISVHRSRTRRTHSKNNEKSAYEIPRRSEVNQAAMNLVLEEDDQMPSIYEADKMKRGLRPGIGKQGSNQSLSSVSSGRDARSRRQANSRAVISRQGSNQSLSLSGSSARSNRMRQQASSRPGVRRQASNQSLSGTSTRTARKRREADSRPGMSRQGSNQSLSLSGSSARSGRMRQQASSRPGVRRQASNQNLSQVDKQRYDPRSTSRKLCLNNDSSVRSRSIPNKNAQQFVSKTRSSSIGHPRHYSIDGISNSQHSRMSNSQSSSRVSSRYVGPDQELKDRWLAKRKANKQRRQAELVQPELKTS